MLSMKKNVSVVLFGLVSLLVASVHVVGLAHAQTSEEAKSEEAMSEEATNEAPSNLEASGNPVVSKKSLVAKTPHGLVSDTMNALLARFESIRSGESEGQSEAYLSAVEELVAPVVDFDLIAKRVMSRYFSLATEQQVVQFTDVFRQSLLETYAKGMAAYADQKIDLLPFKGVKKKGSRVRAVVDMEVRGRDGKIYPVQYAMYQRKEGGWKLENLVLNGVNIGLTFRNQFNEAMRRNQGNIDKVISEWNATSSDRSEA